MLIQQESTNIFEDDGKLIELAHRYIELREKLKREATTDPSRTPTPTLLARELQLSVEEVLELQDFADNFLGDFEREYIEQRAAGYIDLEGRPVDPFLGA